MWFGDRLVRSALGWTLTERQRLEDQLAYFADHDPLTGLLNRRAFQSQLAAPVALVERDGGVGSVLLIGIDDFKIVNSRFGQRAGDEALVCVARLLAGRLRPGDVIARFGGDEFGVFLPDTTPAAAAEFAEDLLRSLREEPIIAGEPGGLDYPLTASIGIAVLGPAGEARVADAMSSAAAAMCAAKAGGRDRFVLGAAVDPDRKQKEIDGLRRAIASGEFVLHYQPQIQLADHRVHGGEALLRWAHPTRGLLLPREFLPAVEAIEASDLAGLLIGQVLDGAIAQCGIWRREGRDLSVSVNVCARDLLDTDLPQRIERMLSERGVPPHALELEISERMRITDMDRTVATLSDLNALGVRVSLDNFGGGFNSFFTLKHLRLVPAKRWDWRARASRMRGATRALQRPTTVIAAAVRRLRAGKVQGGARRSPAGRSVLFHTVKIDRDLVPDGPDRRPLADLITFFHSLDLAVVATRVESQLTLDRVADLGCDRAQGNHFSEPLPPDAFVDWVAHWTPDRSTVAEHASPR